MEFESAICTSVEQSKRLLELGLKKETADMHITNMSSKGVNYTDDWQIGSEPYKDVMNFLEERGLQLGETSWEILPAWGLHRLVKIMFKGDIEGFVGYNIHANSVNIMYEYAISNIEALIKMGSFNKDYLEEKL